MTRALDPEVMDAIWETIEPLLPRIDDSHPLGCHNPRVADRVCFRGLVIRLVTGSSWTDIEAIMGFEVSDTTLRRRRDEWIDAGVFDRLEAEARSGYDRIIELDLNHVAIDGSLHKAPCGGEGTGKSPVDRAKLGWKWSVAAEANGIPIGWAIDGANRNDIKLLEPTLDAIEATGLLEDIGTLSLDRGYDYPAIQASLHDRGLFDLDIQKRGTKPEPGEPHRLTLGLRWIVEATNTWWSNYGQLRRSTDRRNHHRHAALQLATTVLITGRLIDWRNRWSPNTAPTG
jgi:transposase